MPRVALRVAYDGARFHGSQRQPGVRTVERELLDALGTIGAVQDVPSARFLAASRTDRGVSAAGNVFALDTAFDVDALPGAVNAHARDLWVTAVAPAPESFHPRASPRRAYRYHAWAGDVGDEAAFARALALFEGEHDFRSFARVDAGQDPVRRLDAVRVTPAGDLVLAEFVAPSFLWNQIRRLVAAARAVARGEVAEDDVARALADPAQHARDFGLAPPEPLVLLDVHHDLPWRTDVKGARRARRALRQRARDLVVRQAVAETLADAAARDVTP